MRIDERPQVKAALSASALARLSPALRRAIVADALLIDVASGSIPQRGHGTHASLLVSGLVRVFHTTAEGRELTVRYARPGGLLGLPSLYTASELEWTLGQQALTQSTILALRPSVVRAVADANASVATLFAEEMATRYFFALRELAGNTFGTMRQRVARHLLDLAAAGPSPRGTLVARVNQQALADAVGSVREVIVRLLRDLREEGLIRTRRDEIEVLAPERLIAETFLRER